MSQLEREQMKGEPSPAEAVLAEASGAVPTEPTIFARAKRALGFLGGDRDHGASGLVGNQLRLLRGGLTALIGGLFAVLFMTLEAQFRWGVPLGILGVAVASFGILDFLGSFDDPEERVAARLSIGDLTKP